MTGTRVLFEVNALSARYGSLLALDNVSLTFAGAARTGIFGHNGSGKSTLLKCLIGAIEDIDGSVQFLEHTIRPGAIHRNVRHGIGMVHQSRNVFPSLTVEQCLRIAGMQPGSAPIATALEMFPILAERREQRAGSMSGGEQQMLAVGMALMRRPKAILLDEPTAGLSPVAAQNVLASLVRINKQYGVAVILVEQNVLASLEIVERAIVMKAGKIVLDSDARALQKNKETLWKYF